MSAHTRGPWTEHQGDDYCHIYGGEFDHSGNPLAECHSSEANARLIAAAPELLEAVKQSELAFRELIRQGWLGMQPIAMAQARALIRSAIAKATLEPDTEGGDSG